MTGHHHPDIASPGGPNVLYTITTYTAAGVERELLLVDYHGLTIVDLLADGTDGDQHIVAERLENLVEAGDIADAHVAKSIELGRPAVPSAEPPTEEQLRYLRSVADAVGASYAPPASKAEATTWIERCSPSRRRPAWTQAAAWLR